MKEIMSICSDHSAGLFSPIVLGTPLTPSLDDSFNR